LAEWIGSGQINLQDCNRAQLVKIKGIGYKTASMFLMYTKRNFAGACLDTHILKYLRDETPVQNVPESTPITKAEYKRLEDEFLKIVRASGKKVAEFDFEIWSRYRQKVNTETSSDIVTANVTVTEPVSTGLI
jgi:thermostable 8-oxoguanine DNA glycosylase